MSFSIFRRQSSLHPIDAVCHKVHAKSAFLGYASSEAQKCSVVYLVEAINHQVCLFESVYLFLVTRKVQFANGRHFPHGAGLSMMNRNSKFCFTVMPKRLVPPGPAYRTFFPQHPTAPIRALVFFTSKHVIVVAVVTVVIAARRLTEQTMCGPYMYEIDAAAGKVLFSGPPANMDGALPMELPKVSCFPCERAASFLLNCLRSSNARVHLSNPSPRPAGLQGQLHFSHLEYDHRGLMPTIEKLSPAGVEKCDNRLLCFVAG